MNKKLLIFFICICYTVAFFDPELNLLGAEQIVELDSDNINSASMYVAEHYKETCKFMENYELEKLIKATE